MLTNVSMVRLLIIPFSLALPCLAEKFWEDGTTRLLPEATGGPNTTRMGYFIEGSGAGHLATLNFMCLQNCSQLTSLCNWDSLFVFLPKYTCLSLLFIFSYEPYVPPDYHYCSPHVRLWEFVLLPRTSCFLVAYTPSWLKHLVFSATYMSLYLFSFIVFCSVNNISGVFSCPFVLLGCVPRTSKVDMACLVALNGSLRLHNYVIFILREQRLSNYEF